MYRRNHVFETIVLSVTILFLFVSVSTVFAQAPNDSGLVTDLPEPDAAGAVLIEQRTGKVLFSHNMNSKLYPASTTKILTALIAIEHGDLNELITVGNEANLAALDGSKAGLDIGEQILLSDLIRGLMLASGNDAGYTIAVHIGRKYKQDFSLSIADSIAAFTELMNRRAQQLGAKNSHFQNPHGYHQDGHYTTAYDLALIARAAMNHDFFAGLVSSRLHEYPDWSTMNSPESDENDTRYWVNRNRLLNPQSEFFYPYATGIKTGWTTPAGPCLVSSASKNGFDLIAVVLNTTRNGQWIDSRLLFEYGFNNFTNHRLVYNNQSIGSIGVENYKLGGESDVNVITLNGFEDVFKKSDIQNVTKYISWDYNCPEGKSRIVAPIIRGQIIGEIFYYLNDEVIFQTPLLATEGIEERTMIDTIVYRMQTNSIFYYLNIFAISIIVLFSTRMIIRFKSRHKSKKKLTYHKYS